MTLSEALKRPGVWWVVFRDYHYHDTPIKIEVIVDLEYENKSIVKIDDGLPTAIDHDFDNWEAYSNFWLAWAAIQRSKA